MNRGFTTLELVFAMVISGIVLGISLPRLAEAWNRLIVDQETRRIVSAHRRARVTAILESQDVELFIAAESLALHLADGGQPIWREEGPSSRGVELGGGPKKLTFSPVGISTGVSNATFSLTRGIAARTIVVSRLGRLRIR
jgi:Tfp pilus assembly protein FimT